jgi:hypothetical protein
MNLIEKMNRATEEEKYAIVLDGHSVFTTRNALDECMVTLEGQLEDDSLFSNEENDFINPLVIDWNIRYAVTHRSIMEAMRNDREKSEYRPKCMCELETKIEPNRIDRRALARL